MAGSVYTSGAARTTTTGAVAAEIPLDMGPGVQYRLTARTAGCWYRVVVAGEAINVAASAGDDSHFLPVNASVAVAAIGPSTITARYRGKISVIRDGGSDGTATLSEVAPASSF